jgi:hypothetical protein
MHVVMSSESLSSHVLSINVKIIIEKTVILHAVLYGHKAWSPTFREEHRLRVFENSVLRRIFGPERNDVMGGWKTLHEKLHSLCCSLDIIRVIK